MKETEPAIDWSLVGEICHIQARKPHGPRGDVTLTSEEIDRYDNLILLCRSDHKLVDDHPLIYTPAKLRELKTAHEKWVETELNKLTLWESNISQFSYLNIPRLSILAAIHGYRINLPLTDEQTLHSLGWKLNHVLLEFSSLLMQLDLKAVRLPAKFTHIDDQLLGINFSFSEQFRTKNLRHFKLDQVYTLSGDIDKDPHLYRQVGDWKLILPFDPRWVTTTTAWSEFRPSSGQRKFAGLCTVKRVDTTQRKIWATPLVIGFPKTAWDVIVSKWDDIESGKLRVLDLE